ncbi:Ig-like domain-containing protein, partial [Salinicola aestuarinus]|uniref:Ig-like domain-containing protein n=1 Tax=Salinicola aestuarinus TaxID=1949082 RepID=UPI001FD8ACA0
DSGASTNDATPRLNGQAEAGSTVTVFQDDVEIGTTTAGNDGTWSFPVEALPDGEVTFSATATDANGNESVASDPFTLTIDTTAPNAPIIDPTDGETITGTAEAGSTVTLRDDDDNVLGTVPADENGNWSFTPTPALADGAAVTATATDDAGNTGPEGTATVDVDFDDQTPPVAPTLNSATDNVAPNAGNLDSGTSTNDATPRLNGQAEAGSTVTVFQDDVEVGTTTAGNDGTWSFPVEALPDGEVTFSATATDANGNVSTPSDPFTLTIDTTPPAEGDNTVSFADDVYSADEADSAILTGQIEDGASIDTLTITSDAGGEPVVIEGVDIDLTGGTFSTLADLSGLNDGTLTATLSITDEAGNTADFGDTATLDTLADAAPLATLTSNDADGLINAGDADTAS